MRTGPSKGTAPSEEPVVAGIVMEQAVDEVEIRPGAGVFDMQGVDGEQWYVVPAAGHQTVALRFGNARTVGVAYIEACAENQPPPPPEPRYIVRVLAHDGTTTATVFALDSGAFARWLGAVREAARDELHKELPSDTEET